jgi:hypothetical protein
MTTSIDDPAAHAPTLLWTPELAAEANTARELFPSFFDCDPDPPRETHTAFAKLRAAFAGLPREYLERGLVRPGLTRAKDETVQRLIRVYGDGDDTFDAETEGAALVLFPVLFGGLVALDPGPLLVTAWVARAGVVGALEALVASFEPLGALSSAPFKLAWLGPAPQREHETLLYEPADVLRAQIGAASPAEQLRAKARAAELRASANLATRLRLAQLFADRAWLEEDLSRHVETQAPEVVPATALLAASPEVLRRSLAAMSLAQAYALAPIGRCRPFALAYLDARREEGVRAVSAWLERLASLHDPKVHSHHALPYQIRELLETLRCVEHAPEVVRAAVLVLIKLGSQKLTKDADPRPAAIDSLCRSPSSALPFVREAAKGRSAWARDLLPRLERLAGAGPTYELATEADLPAALLGRATFKPPAFWTPESFSAPLLTNGKALPPNALARLATQLAKPDASGDALAAVKTACTPESLAAFAWDLFQAWLDAGAPAKDKWAVLTLGTLGDDSTARKLTPLIRAWPGESQHARAVTGLDVLAMIGSDVAMMMLHGIAQRVKFKGLQERAREKMDEIAARRGLTAEELADRLVPDLSLEDDGSKVLDFGPRSFRVGFDETLSPFVTDASGARLRDLPKPNQKDDAELAATAVDTWKAMKKDAKTLAALQILRLELAMGNARRWHAQDFETFLVHHPLLGHLVRRLVWGVFDGDALTATFRVAEDRSYADRADEAFSLAATACHPVADQPAVRHRERVGVVHRLQLSDEDAAAWATVFRDYALAQPFEQLTREVFRLTPEEQRADRLARFEKRKVETKRVLGLLSRGWRKGAAEDGGLLYSVYKTISKDLAASVAISGIDASSLADSDPTQDLGLIEFGLGDPSWGFQRPLPLATIDPIVLSEVIRDLESLGQIETVR